MGLADKLRADALHVVTAGGYDWQIRRVAAADLAAAKHVSLMVLSREALLPAATPTTPEQALDHLQRQARRLAPADVAKLRAADAAIVVAAVTAFRDTGAEAWIPCLLCVEDDAQGTTPDGRERLALRDLPPGVEVLLAAEATTWAVGGAAAVEALRAFRDVDAGDAPDAAPAGEGVQHPPLRAVAGGE